MHDGQPPQVTTVFYGFGACAEAAANTLLRRRRSASGVLVLAAGEEAMRAEALGLSVDVANRGLPPGFDRFIIDVQDADDAMRAIRQARTAAPASEISVVCDDPALIRTLVTLGASKIVSPALIAGLSLAATVVSVESRPEKDS